MRTKGWMATALLAAGGCARAVSGVDADPDAAILAFYGEPAVVTVPETATAGQPFTVEIRTYGGGCVAQGTTEVSVSALTAHLRPRDVRSRTATVCTADLRLYRREAFVRFNEPGRATVRIYGVRQDRDVDREPLVITRTVIVR